MRKLPAGAAFGHALSSTFDNLGFAFHVSWPWILVMLPVQLVGNLYLAANGLLEPDPDNPDGRYFAVIFLLGVVSILAFSSIAVSWHRYILRDEVPQGWQRLRLDGTVWRYIGNVILSFLAMFAVVFAGALPLGALAFVLGPTGGGGVTMLVAIFVGALMCIAMVIFYRLSIKLPAVALERRDFGFPDAWRAAAGNDLRILALILLFFLTIFVVGMATAIIVTLLGNTLGSAGLAVAIAVQVVVNWISTIVGVTLLTSLYGFFVEGRDF